MATYGERPSGRIPARSTAPRPLVRTQPEQRDGTQYIVVSDDHRTVHTGPSMERARTVAIRNSIGAHVAHLYRLTGEGRMSPTKPIATYFDGRSLNL